MVKVKLLKNRCVRTGVKAFVVVCGLLWCGSRPANHLFPNRTSEPLAANETRFEQAIQMARAGNAREATDILARLSAAEESPERRASLCCWRSWSAQLAGDVSGQIRAAEEGLALVPNDPELTAKLADGLVTRHEPKDLARAEQMLAEAIRVLKPSRTTTGSPYRYDLYRMLASVRYLKGDLIGARAAVDEASRVSPFKPDQNRAIALRPPSEDSERPRTLPVGPGPAAGELYR